MYPKVKPALARAWRDLQTVQFGVTPAQAVVLGPIDMATGSFIEQLDGSLGPPALRERARVLGLPEGRADELVARLAKAGLLEDVTAGGAAAQSVRRRIELVERLRPDLGSLSLRRREPGGALRALAARRGAWVQVRGLGRVGAVIASVLSGAGVGRVEVMDGGVVEPGDPVPGGMPPEAVGLRRAVAGAELVRDSAPERGPGGDRDGGPGAGRGRAPGPDGAARPALVVVTPREGIEAHAPDPGRAADWLASGTPHLYAGVLEGTGIVGPLVLPGDTACAGCMERERVDRDPAWPRLLTQWRSGRGRAGPACDMGLAVAVAGLAAAHALAFLDGELPGSAGARWEAALPGLDWRRSVLVPHPGCPCGAVGGGPQEHSVGRREPHDTMAG
ncbi:TOMM precursor leader peptide-binding protein [Streptomyces sp. NPDC093225]|uniref:TOMM precursor leader peptide-binding protein n=1 Tax=Streptomyces sp. NPDC093225 TaxID=3366034 RepID=UPI0038234C2B